MIGARGFTRAAHLHLDPRGARSASGTGGRVGGRGARHVRDVRIVRNVRELRVRRRARAHPPRDHGHAAVAAVARHKRLTVARIRGVADDVHFITLRDGRGRPFGRGHAGGRVHRRERVGARRVRVRVRQRVLGRATRALARHGAQLRQPPPQEALLPRQLFFVTRVPLLALFQTLYKPFRFC